MPNPVKMEGEMLELLKKSGHTMLFDDLERLAYSFEKHAELKDDLILVIIGLMEKKHYQRKLDEEKNNEFLSLIGRMRVSLQDKGDLAKSNQKLKEIINNFRVSLC